MTNKEKLDRLVQFIKKDVRSFGLFELSHQKKADWYDHSFKTAGKLLDELEL